MKGPLVVVVIVVLVAGAGVGGALFASKGGSGGASGAPAAEVTRTIVLEERTLNLSDAEDSHFLKIAPVLEVVSETELSKDAAELQPVLMDTLIDVVSRSTYAGLLTADGKQDLKKQLATAFGERLAGRGVKVREVLFLDFVME